MEGAEVEPLKEERGGREATITLGLDDDCSGDKNDDGDDDEVFFAESNT